MLVNLKTEQQKGSVETHREETKESKGKKKKNMETGNCESKLKQPNIYVTGAPKEEETERYLQ